MSQPSGNDYFDVLKILRRYYRALLAKFAEEVRDNPEEFNYPMLGNAESLLEKYSSAIYHFRMVYGDMQAEGEALFQEKLSWLREDQFLCFSCRGIMSKEVPFCPACGWSWQGNSAGHWVPAEQKMTERTKRVLSLARDQARRLRQSQVEPEHLLLALAQETQGTAARALAGMGIDYTMLEGRIEKPSAQAPALPDKRQIPLSAVAEQLLADAWGECRQLESGQLGTGHLLLAMTRLLGEPATRIAGLLKADLAVVRDQVVALLELDSAQ